MPEALSLVKRELGPEAVILNTRTLPGAALAGLTGRATVEIIAAPGGAPVRTRETSQRAASAAAPTPGVKAPSSACAPLRAQAEHELPADLMPHFHRLVQQEFSATLAEKLARHIERLPASQRSDPRAVREQLQSLMRGMIPIAGGIELNAGATRRVALVGPPGAGKTTTLVKLAAHFKLRQNRSVAILSLDVHRIANHEQMRRYGELIGVPVLSANSPRGVREALRTLPATDLLLIDTHGVSPTETGRLARLAAMLRAAHADELHLVLPASTSAAVQQRICDTFSPLSATRVVLTRVDEAIGLGVVLGAIERLSGGLSYLSSGQHIPTDLEEATAERVAALVLADG